MPIEPPGLVIVGRDGVINRRGADVIKSAADWQPIPGSLEAIARLNQAGFVVVVATNQSGVSVNQPGISDLNAIHVKFQRALARVGGHVDGIFFCPHAPDADCGCRMPRRGLLDAISQRFGVSLSGVPLVGDLARHALTALAVGALPVMVRSGGGVACFRDNPELRELPWFDDLATATCYLLDQFTPT